jgi:hypothetical protein
MKKFHEWLVDRDREMAQQMVDEWPQWMQNAALAGGMAAGSLMGGQAQGQTASNAADFLPTPAAKTAQANPGNPAANFVNLQKGQSFHPYSWRSSNIPGRPGTETPDYDAAWKNYQMNGRSGLNTIHEPIFQSKYAQQIRGQR